MAPLISALVLVCFALAGGVCATATAQTSNDDEAALRSLAERFYHAYEPDDRTVFLSLWSRRSLDPESKNTTPSKYEKKHLDSLIIEAVDINGDTAKVSVKVHLSGVLKPGAKANRGIFNNESYLTLRCVKEDGMWKVMEHVATEQELAEDVARAGTHQARVDLIAKHPELHTLTLVYELAGGYQAGGTEHLFEDDFQKWIDIKNLAIQIATEIGETQAVATVLNEIGDGFRDGGDQTQALEYYLKSIRVIQSVDAGAAEKVPAWTSVASIYVEQGNDAQALAILQKLLDPANPNRGLIQWIASLYTNMGDYDRAIDYLNQGRTLAEKQPPGRNRDLALASSLRGMANVYLAQRDYSKAAEFCDQAIRLVEPIQAATVAAIAGQALVDQNLSSLLNMRAYIALMQGDPKSALQLNERANGIAKKETSLVLAGRIHRELGLNAKARELLDHAIKDSEYRRTRAVGDEQSREQYFESLLAPYTEMIKLLVAEKNFDEAFEYAEASKARALLDVLQNGRVEISKSLTADQRKRETELRRDLETLNVQLASAMRQANKARIAQVESKLQQARLDYESYKTNLYALHPELKTNRAEFKPSKVGDTAPLLSTQHTVLLEYAVTDQTTYCFVISNDGSSKKPSLKVFSIPIQQKELEDRVERYRTNLAKRDPAFVQISRDLFSLLLGPFAKELSAESSLVLVPDGVLWDLPFQALQSENQRYLIEEHDVSYAPSLTALMEMSKRNREASGVSLDLLALGNPLVGPTVQERIKTGLMDDTLEPLPEAQKEVLALGHLYGSTKSKVYIGSSANETNAKSNAPQSRVIQFATHGILDSRNPMYSHLVLSQSGDDEDGLLEAWEIMKLDLHADLVVLAACETARGHVGAGEGMIGMSWAFFVAGTATTVASQWKVDSASTTELMLEFHRQLKSRQAAVVHVSKASALRSASLKLLKSRQYQHPFYWAGFVLIGDGN